MNCETDHVIGFPDHVDLWVIRIKSPWSFARLVLDRARNADDLTRVCEQFVYSIVKITRLSNIEDTFLEKFTRRAKVCGLFYLDCASRVLIGWAGNCDNRYCSGQDSAANQQSPRSGDFRSYFDSGFKYFWGSPPSSPQFSSHISCHLRTIVLELSSPVDRLLSSVLRTCGTTSTPCERLPCCRASPTGLLILQTREKVPREIRCNTEHQRSFNKQKITGSLCAAAQIWKCGRSSTQKTDLYW